LGIFNSTSPALVASNGSRAPLRQFVALGADHVGRLGIDQRLQHEFDTLADDIDIATGADRVQ
jgi:hypothetical protein